MSALDLSVVVVTHNGRERALETLRSALAAGGGVDVQWIVVDSGSSDGVADAIAAEHPEIELHRLPNVGFAAANNAAFRHVRGRHVLLLNPDVDIVSGTLADLVRALDARPTVGAASVIQLGPDGALLPSIRRDPSPSRQLGEALLPPGRLRGAHAFGELETRPAAYETERAADWLVGAFLAVRRDALEQAGPFDERFFLYSEETDLCRRIREAGWEVRHLPDLRITHHLGGYARPELAAQLAYSKLLYARKHLRPAQRGMLRAALAVGHGLRALALLAATAAGRGGRSRLSGEARATAVALGLAGAPMKPEAAVDAPAEPAPVPPLQKAQ